MSMFESNQSKTMFTYLPTKTFRHVQFHTFSQGDISCLLVNITLILDKEPLCCKYTLIYSAILNDDHSP